MPKSAPPTVPPPGARPSDEEGDRTSQPTLVPAFDPEAFARDSEMRQRVAPAPAGNESTIDQARRLHEQGDDEDALFLLARLTELAPLHPEATSLTAACCSALERKCLSVIGSESSVLVAAVSDEELKSFALDNVAAFLLSLLDGTTRVEDVLDASGMPRLLALRQLRNLVERGIVVTASGRRRR